MECKFASARRVATHRKAKSVGVVSTGASTTPKAADTGPEFVTVGGVAAKLH
jgi:hypothetical protein